MLNEAEWNEQEKAFENAIICNQCYMKEKCKKPGECEPSKMPPIDPSKYNVTESGQVLKSLSSEQYAEQTKAFKDALASDKDKASDYVHIRYHDYTKIQNYIEAIRLIAEKVGTAESDCIEQLARDVGSYLYDLVKGDKDND